MHRFIAMLLAVVSGGVAAQVSSGTAFVVAPGLLVTNQHVVAGCGSVDVITADGRRTGAIVDSDAQIDLALLRATGIKGATARLRHPRSIRLGESVMVFGFPLAGSLSSGGNFTSGLVSAVRGLKDAAGEIQVTAPVQPGNSGGPLMDASGLVIGVVQAKLDALKAAIVTGDIPQNVNFAISLEVLAEFLAKNKVAYRDGVLSAPLSTARVAELAQSFTYRVECRDRSLEIVWDDAPQVAPSLKPKLPVSKWVKASSSSDAGVTIYVDLTTISRSGSMVKMWDMKDFKTAQVISGNRHLSLKALEEYDCKDERSRPLSFTLYSGNIGNGNIVQSVDGRGNWTNFTPGSMGETLWKLACGKQ